MMHIQLPAAFVGGLPGGGEILIVLVVLLLLFGSKRLPQIARTLGKTMEEFRKATREVSSEFMRAADEPTEEKTTQSLPEPSDSDFTPEPTQAEGAFHRGTDLEVEAPTEEKQDQVLSEPSDSDSTPEPIQPEGASHRGEDLEVEAPAGKKQDQALSEPSNPEGNPKPGQAKGAFHRESELEDGDEEVHEDPS